MFSISNGLESEQVAMQVLTEEAVPGVQSFGGYCQLSWHISIWFKEEKKIYTGCMDSINAATYHGLGTSYIELYIHFVTSFSLSMALACEHLPMSLDLSLIHI